MGKKADSDMRHILENIVYFELLRRGYKVYVGKVDDKVLERELKSLQKTGDHYPKYLITYDMDMATDYDGIMKINIVDWLLNKE